MCGVNLMTTRALRWECCRDQARRWGCVIAVAGILMVIVAGVLQLKLHGNQQRLNVLEARYEPIAQLLNLNKLYREQIEQIRSEEQFVLMLSKKESLVTLLGLLAQASAEESQSLFFQKIAIENSETMQVERVNSGVIAVAGISSSKAVIDDFVSSLKSTLPVEKVDVTSSREMKRKNRSLHEYNLECTY